MTTIRPAASSTSLRWEHRHQRDAGRIGRGAPSGFADRLEALPAPAASTEPREERDVPAIPDAPFVAQLLAHRLRVLDAPRRRRSDREEVDARYQQADVGTWPTAAGSLVRREA